MSSEVPLAAAKTQTARKGSALFCGVALLVSAASLGGAASAETIAGTRVVNVAALTADEGRAIARSNEVVLVAAERLDVALAVLPRSTGPVALTLTNIGNGTEAFTVRAAVADPAVAVRTVAIDRNGDGRFDAAVDTVLDGVTPPLAAGGSLRLLVVLASDRPLATALTVAAAAVTASGEPGTLVPSLGDAGGDAVVGPTGARASVSLGIDAASSTDSETARATLVKSQRVVAPDGSTLPVAGAVVTYTLVAQFAAAVTGARLDDPVPAGTVYLPGSLRVDGSPVADAGVADGRRVGVTLGDAAAGTTRTIEFQVRIS